MNKQELIDELKKLLEMPSEVQGHNYGLRRAITLAEQLDEPEKQVVPKYVADWMEWCKKNNITFLGAGTAVCNNKNIRTLDASAWAMKNQETFAKAWFYGYEVEKEKLYTAKLKSTGEYLHRDTDALKVHHSFAEDYTVKRLKTYHFTKDTLLKYSAWENDFYSVIEVEE